MMSRGPYLSSELGLVSRCTQDGELRGGEEKFLGLSRTWHTVIETCFRPRLVCSTKVLDSTGSTFNSKVVANLTFPHVAILAIVSKKRHLSDSNTRVQSTTADS